MYVNLQWLKKSKNTKMRVGNEKYGAASVGPARLGASAPGTVSSSLALARTRHDLSNPNLSLTRYDLFKLFRTSGEMSHLALRDFLRCYARCLAPPGSPARGARARVLARAPL